MAQPVDLVFEGGGAKGLVFLGALRVLAEQGYAPRRLVGTSAGAITAALLAAGYTADSFMDVARERAPDGRPRFATFLDPPTAFSDADVDGSELFAVFRQVSVLSALTRVGVSIPALFTGLDDRVRHELIRALLVLPPARSLFSFVERGGLFVGSAFLGWLREKLDARRPGWAESTLGQFFADTNCDLSVVASDTTGNEMLVLNHRTAPDCPTAWAVRMSMSIPFLWQEVRWDAAWGGYLGRDLSGHAIVDGGVLSNFPLGLLTAADAATAALMGPAGPGGARVLGLLIDEQLEVPGAGAGGGPSVNAEQWSITSLRTVQRVRRLVDTLTEAHDKQVIAANEALVCRLPAKGYGTTEFDMSEARMEALVAAGAAATTEYFRQHG
jgi:predicted acylesterase/phospholipase RssA